MRVLTIAVTALVLAPAPLGAMSMGQVTEMSPLVLAQDSKSDSKDKAKKKKKANSGTTAPTGGSPGPSTKDSY